MARNRTCGGQGKKVTGPAPISRKIPAACLPRSRPVRTGVLIGYAQKEG